MTDLEPGPLRILLLEDNPADAELEEHALRKAGMAFELRRVDKRENFERELESFRPDVVLLDYQVPGFPGSEALQLVRRRHPEFPVVMVSGALGDESVAELLKSGAKDYVLKDNLKRLPHAVNHALAMEAGIRARKAAEVKVLESAQSYLSAIRSMRDAFVVLNGHNGHIVEWNPAAERMFGYSREEAMGREVHHLIAPERFHAASDEGVRKFAETGQGAAIGRTLELVARHKDGHEFPIELSLSVTDTEGHCQVVGVVRDITVKKRAEEELDRHRHHLEAMVAERTAQLAEARDKAEAATRAKAAFLANMSHEIRTPMNAILGMVHLLKRGGASPRQIGQLIQIEESSRHLLQLINDILDLSKVEAGRLTLECSPLSIEATLAQVCSMQREAVAAKGLGLEVETDAALPDWLLGDPTRLTQALLNYVNNAVKFTEHGRVVLRARRMAETKDGVLVRIEVEDTGIGIDAATQARLFSAFEQGDTSTSRCFGGTGLGLAITRSLAELMGGSCGVVSTPGAGSTFWFTARLLRASDEAVATAATPPPFHDAEGEVSRTRRGARLLLVDDEPVNQRVAREILEGAGLTVEQASDGAEAVERFAADPAFDAVLMDIQMPVLDGLAATRAIRALADGKKVPILAMTANAFAEDRERCLETGMNDFIAKPVDPPMLFDTLLRWLPPRAGPPAPTFAEASSKSATTPVEPPAELARLSERLGAGIAKAVKNLHGDLADYKRLLLDFIRRQEGLITELRIALEAGDHAQAGAMAHRVKGAAGSLGLTALQEAAGALYIALRHDDAPAVEPGILALSAALDDLREITVDWSEARSEGGADDLDPETALKQLEAMLAIDDASAIDFFHADRALLERHLATDLSHLAREIGDFDFKAALTRLHTLSSAAPAAPGKAFINPGNGGWA
jgi:PAS domain S-box-containing protein